MVVSYSLTPPAPSPQTSWRGGRGGEAVRKLSSGSAARRLLHRSQQGGGELVFRLELGDGVELGRRRLAVAQAHVLVGEDEVGLRRLRVLLHVLLQRPQLLRVGVLTGVE